MGFDVVARKISMKGYILVRDKNGKPKVDNPQTLPQELFDLLTEAERFELYQGIYPDHLKV